jgi:uncharacterized protein YlxW (UPF0749 family)
MGIIEQYIKDYNAFIILGLMGLVLIMFIIMLVNNARISKLSRKYKKFMRGSKDKNIEELIMDLMAKADDAREEAREINALYKDMDGRLNKCVQKVSIVRYKAFDDIGSAALSFSIALLDAQDDGVIITGIYGRSECTTYAKPINKGIAKYDLSNEEKQALEDAMKRKLKTE